MNWDIDTEEGMANAIAWQKQLLAVVTQGDRWVVPRSLTIFEIDHAGKTVRKCSGGRPEPTIVRVLKAAGWRVVGPDGKREIDK